MTTEDRPRRDWFDAVQRLEGRLGNLTPTLLAGKSRALEAFLSSTLVPLIGFNAWIIGLMDLAHLQPEHREGFGIAATISGIAALVFFHRRVANSAAPGVVLLAYGGYVFLPGKLALAFSALLTAYLCILILRRRLSRHALWWAAVYCPILAHQFEIETASLRLVAAGIVFGVAAVAFMRGRQLSATAAAFFGFLVAALAEFDAYQSGKAMQVVMIVLFAVLTAIYEFRLRSSRRSNLHLFLVDTLIVAFVVLAVLVFSAGGVMTGKQSLTVAGVLVIIYVMARSALERFGNPARLAWAAFACCFIIGANVEDQFPAFVSLTIVTGVVLQIAAVHFASRFLSRCALVILAIFPLIYLIKEREASFTIVLLAVATSLAIAACARPFKYKRSVPWWSGLVRDRHMVWLRRVVRLIIALVLHLPLIRLIVTVPRSVAQWLRYMKSDGVPYRVDDLIVIGGHLIGILIVSDQLESYANQAGIDIETFWIMRSAVWMIWGTAIFAFGSWRSSAYYRLLGLAFIAVPVVVEVTRWLPDRAGFYAWIGLIAGAAFALTSFIRLRPFASGANRGKQEPE